MGISLALYAAARLGRTPDLPRFSGHANFRRLLGLLSKYEEMVLAQPWN
jgi:hypothetical protein